MPPVNEELRFNATLQDGFSSDFRRLTTNAQAGTTRLGNSLTRFSNVARVATLRAGLFTAATVALGKGVETFVSRQAELIDAIGKGAEATGLALNEYQGLRLQFELAGGSARGFETAMRTLTRAIGDANRGVGQGRQIFEDLGIALTDSGGNIRATADVLDDLNTALSTLTSDSQRNSILAALVGSRNTTATNLLFQQYAGRSIAGGASADLAAITGGGYTQEQADTFAEWNDEFRKLQETTSVLFSRIAEVMANEFLPTIITLRQTLSDLNENFFGLVVAVKDITDSLIGIATLIVPALLTRRIGTEMLRMSGGAYNSKTGAIIADPDKKLGRLGANINSIGGIGAMIGAFELAAQQFTGTSPIGAARNFIFGPPSARPISTPLYDGDYMRQFIRPSGIGNDRVLGEGTPVQVIIKDIAPELKQGTGTPMAMPIPDGLGIPTTTTTPAKSAAARQREVFEFQEMMGNNSYNASLIADSAGLLADHSKKAAKIQVVASTAAAIMQQFATPGLWFGLAWVNAAIILRLGREQLKAIDSGQLSEIGNAPATTTQTQIQTVNTQAAAFDYSLQLGTGQQGVGNIQNLSDALRNSRGLVDTGGI